MLIDIRFRLAQLAADTLGSRTNLCPRCRRDLTESVRGHLYGCAMLPAEVRRRAQEVRDAARRLVKESQVLPERSDVLIREGRGRALRAPARASGGDVTEDRILARA